MAHDESSRIFNEPPGDGSLLACLQCDLVQRLPQLAYGESARCPRCGTELERRREDSLNRSLALTVAAALLYAIANTTPMLALHVAGRHAATTVFGGSIELWNEGEKIVACLVLLSAVIAPGLQILLMLLILRAAMRRRLPHWIAVLMRYHPVTKTWSMIEVMLVGVLVALVKIAELATVVPGAALFALAGLVFVFAAIQSVFDPSEVWGRVAWADPRRPAPATGGEDEVPRHFVEVAP